MNNTEEALKERIKELTCLYEVSSILVNADTVVFSEAIRAIAFSLKKGFKFPNDTEIAIETPIESYKTGTIGFENSVTSDIIIFNKIKGKIIASHKSSEYSFLNEEQPLLDNVALKLGSFLERIEIQNNETSLKRQMEQTDRLRILGEITAGIAHELNTPLANILGFAELLKNDMAENSKSLNDVDKIIKNAIFTREVVKKLMFFACEMPQEMKRINLVPHIKNTINLLDATFRKEQVKYIVMIDDDELWFRADPIQLTQIIFNLLMNAIYFSPKGGLVTIEAQKTKKEIILRISDEGKGIATEDLEKVFQPFFTTKPTGDGSGLGLSVVHGIITSHKGTIKAENNIKKGAIFTITLPND